MVSLSATFGGGLQEYGQLVAGFCIVPVKSSDAELLKRVIALRKVIVVCPYHAHVFSELRRELFKTND